MRTSSSSYYAMARILVIVTVAATVTTYVSSQDGGGMGGGGGNDGGGMGGGGSGAGSCSLCPGEGSTMGNLDQPLYLIDGNCGDVEAILGFLPSDSTECTDIQSSASYIAVDTWCGCSGSSPDPPNVCDLCGGDATQLLDPDLELTVPGFDALSVTCQEAFEFIPYIKDAAVCNLISNFAAQECCSPDSISDRETLDEACAICPTGTVMEKADQEIVLAGAGITCGVVEQELVAYLGENNTQACVDAKSLVGLILDFESLCGCTGSVPPALDTCQICNGAGLTDPDLEISLDQFGLGPLGLPTITCGQVDEIAQYMTSSLICSQLFPAVINPICCAGGTAGSGGGGSEPTDAPTMAPTTTPPTEAPTASPTTASPTSSPTQASLPNVGLETTEGSVTGTEGAIGSSAPSKIAYGSFSFCAFLFGTLFL